MNKYQHIAELIEELVRSIVDCPDAVSLEIKESSLFVQVSGCGDAGIVIGQGGRNFHSLRTIARLASYGLGSRLALEKIRENDDPKRQTHFRHESLHLSEKQIADLIDRTVGACAADHELDTVTDEDGLRATIRLSMPPTIGDQLERALRNIFSTIGEQNGIVTTVRVENRPDEKFEHNQPKTASGRYSKET